MPDRIRRRAPQPATVVLLLLLLSALPAAAQPAAAPADPAARLATMDDRAVREELRARLLAEVAGAGAGGPAAAAMATPAETPLQQYARRLDEVAATYPRLPEMLADTFQRPHGTGPAVSPLRLAGGLMLLFAAGAAAMLAMRRALRLDGAAAPLPLRLAAGMADLVAFTLGVLLSYAALRPAHPAAPAILLAALQFALTVLVSDRLLAILIAPEDPVRRPLPLDDDAARALHRRSVAVVALTAGLLGLLDLMRALGLPSDGAVALGLPLATLPFLYLLWTIWRHRAGITRALAQPLGLGAGHMPALAAWPALASAYLLGLWLVVVLAALRLEHGTGLRLLASLVLALGVPMAALFLSRPLARFYGEEAEVSAAGPPVVRIVRAMWGALVVLGVIGTAMIWGFQPESHTGPGAVLLRLAFNLSVILLLGYVAWTLMIRVIDRALRASRRDGPSTRAQRMATLLPLLRKFLQVVLLAMMVMIVLSSMGIEIGPLLAGAGVVGIALGLGAQSTIADILAGVFFLLEDAFRMDDYVEVGQLRGTVEGISLRSLKLRHHRGAVHTLPFGQIKALTNYTRDWALMRLEFRVPPDTDLNLVKQLVKSISKELSADPEMGPNFIEPLKSQGVRRVEDDALIIGVKFIAKPKEQFVIRREAYHRLIRAFNEHGIHLVGRGVVVRVEDPHAGATVLGFAAREAVRSTEDAPAGAG